ncbi:MAG TPA: hypothetical protein PKE26_05550 [Kiritimatiellia bacterium]|mgnify:CR=1 FL=1|nr:hypothetical protein [Kiritimatiellia bacterium]HMO98558.1 hypothetical protein [Kiritimatiellia bacterium]HMP97568.1 hypothetical protein [Kiritimatiellia bacterium]
MKTREQLESDVVQLVQSHYYSEDFELLSAFQAYVHGLSESEKNDVAGIAFSRLIHEGSMVDILLCSVVNVPSAAPVLAEKLNREPHSNQVTRALIAALKTYATDDAYTAVERFLDSDQELETLQALACIDFVRTLPYLVRLIRKEHVHGIALHILHDRSKAVGLDRLVEELRLSSATQSAGFRENLAKTLRSKKDPYNPFSEAEILRILHAIG